MENKQLQVFKNPEFGEIRVVEKDGEPWFVVADVCSYFGITNRNRVMQNVDAEDKGGTQMNTPGGLQNMAIVNESGLYAVLFALQPTKARGISNEYIAQREKQLRKFKHWITHEVIPSIRKYGAYMTPEKLEEAICNPDTIIEICMQLKLEQERRKQVEAENRQIRPKADYFDNLVEIGPNTNLRDTAKEFCCPPSYLIQWLVAHGYLYRDSKARLKPYQSSVKSGLFVLKEYCVNSHAGLQVLVTPKGRDLFRIQMIDDD